MVIIVVVILVAGWLLSLIPKQEASVTPWTNGNCLTCERTR